MSPTNGGTSKRRLSLGFDRFSGLYIWALFIVVFSIWQPHLFPTGATVHSVASEQAISGILALALVIPLAAGTFDLSVGASINLATVIVTWLQSSHHWGMWPAIVVTLVVSAVIGGLNAVIVVVLHVDSFIATLGTASIIAAIQTIVANNNQPLPPTSTAWSNLTQRDVAGFQIVFVYLLVIAIVLWWVLAHTPVGRYLYAVGGNPEAARLSGVRVGSWVATSLVASSLLAGVGGIFFASLLGPSLTYGQGLLLPAFAAAFLGSTQLLPGRFNVWGTLIALYVLATGVKGLQFVTGVQWLNDMFNGVALVAAVSFAVWRQRAAVSVRRTAHSAGAAPHEPSPGTEDPAAVGLTEEGE